jgi:hypothetical protein
MPCSPSWTCSNVVVIVCRRDTKTNQGCFVHNHMHVYIYLSIYIYLYRSMYRPDRVLRSVSTSSLPMTYRPPQSVAGMELRRMHEDMQRIVMPRPAAAAAAAATLPSLSLSNRPRRITQSSLSSSSSTSSAMKRKRDYVSDWNDAPEDVHETSSLVPLPWQRQRQHHPVSVSSVSSSFVSSTSLLSMPCSFRARFHALKQHMIEAAEKDQATFRHHVSTGASKLRVWPTVKRFFQGLSLREKQECLEREYGCLALLKTWLAPFSDGRMQHETIMEGLLAILLLLPIEKEHLEQVCSISLCHLLCDWLRPVVRCSMCCRVPD